MSVEILHVSLNWSYFDDESNVILGSFKFP